MTAYTTYIYDETGEIIGVEGRSTEQDLTETVRDLAVLVHRHMRNTGNEQTARQVMELIESLDPDPGYAEAPFG